MDSCSHFNFSFSQTSTRVFLFLNCSISSLYFLIYFFTFLNLFLNSGPNSSQVVKQRASTSTPTSTSTGELFVNDIKSNCSDQTLARKYGLNNDGDKSSVFDPEIMSCIKRDEEELKCIVWLDRGSRLVYPLSFLIFNLLYWFKYY